MIKVAAVFTGIDRGILVVVQNFHHNTIIRLWFKIYPNIFINQSEIISWQYHSVPLKFVCLHDYLYTLVD